MMSTWIYPGDDIVSKDQNTKIRFPKLPVPVLITNKKNDSFDHSLFCTLGRKTFLYLIVLYKTSDKQTYKQTKILRKWCRFHMNGHLLIGANKQTNKQANKQTNKHIEVTLSPSFKLVSITMDETSSCHIIFQKSLSVFCLGPIYQKKVCSITD